MRIRRWMGLMSVLVTGCATAQSTEHMEGARELYYLAFSAKDTLPPIHKGVPAPRPAKSAAASHLGLRYTLVLLDLKSHRSEPVDSERIFHRGDCVGIDFESNHSGYLYVLARQSSGSWQPLIPSPEMPDETNVIDPGKKVRAPRRYCFEIVDPPGTETLFVVLSRDPRDFYELYEGIKGTASRPANTSRPSGNVTQMASSKMVNDAVERMNHQFATRDIAVRKVDQPARNDETHGAVYVVNSSDKPSSSIVTEITIRHR